jgi:hypothetical protein
MSTSRAIEVFRFLNMTGSGYSLSALRRVYWPGGAGKFVGKWSLGGAANVGLGPVMALDLTTLYPDLVPPAALAPVAGLVDVALDFSAPECLIDVNCTVPGSAGDSLVLYDFRLVPISF